MNTNFCARGINNITPPGRVEITEESSRPSRKGGLLPRRLTQSDATGPRTVTRLDPCYVSLKALARYSGMSKATLLTHCNAVERALPCYRLGRGKIYVKLAVFDAWLATFETVGPPIDATLKAVGLA